MEKTNNIAKSFVDVKNSLTLYTNKDLKYDNTIKS